VQRLQLRNDYFTTTIAAFDRMELEFIFLSQTAAITASIAAAVTVFTTAQYAYLRIQKRRQRQQQRRRLYRYRYHYHRRLAYERFEFRLDDWPDSLIEKRLR
jgi:ABC-type multidrug transport system fused ATPase/permease subunit